VLVIVLPFSFCFYIFYLVDLMVFLELVCFVIVLVVDVFVVVILPLRFVGLVGFALSVCFDISLFCLRLLCVWLYVYFGLLLIIMLVIDWRLIVAFCMFCFVIYCVGGFKTGFSPFCVILITMADLSSGLVVCVQSGLS